MRTRNTGRSGNVDTVYRTWIEVTEVESRPTTHSASFAINNRPKDNRRGVGPALFAGDRFPMEVDR